MIPGGREAREKRMFTEAVAEAIGPELEPLKAEIRALRTQVDALQAPEPQPKVAVTERVKAAASRAVKRFKGAINV